MDANHWYQAEILREYLNEVESIANRNFPTYEKTQKWIAWAKRKAEAYDPVTNLKRH